MGNGMGNSQRVPTRTGGTREEEDEASTAVLAEVGRQGPSGSAPSGYGRPGWTLRAAGPTGPVGDRLDSLSVEVEYGVSQRYSVVLPSMTSHHSDVLIRCGCEQCHGRDAVVSARVAAGLARLSSPWHERRVHELVTSRGGAPARSS